MADAPALTIVIPVYNGEKYIENTIKSVLRLSDISFELWLVDDGSSDGSADICRTAASRDAKVRYVYQPNAGIAAARNRGVELAEGEYICFVDQDDIFLAEGMRTLLDRVWAEHADLGMCSTMRMMRSEKDPQDMPDGGKGYAENGQDERMTPYESLHDAVYAGTEVREQLLYPLLFRGYDYPFAASEDYFYGSVWKCIFSTAFVQCHGISFKRFVNYEDDWIFVTHALSCAERAVVSAKPGYCWCVNADSESHRPRFVPDLTVRFDRLDAYVSSYIYGGISDKGENAGAELVPDDGMGSAGGISDQAVMDAYRSVALCDHYIELIRNDANIVGRRIPDHADTPGNRDAVGDSRTADSTRRLYRASVRQYLERTGYKEHLKVRRHLKKSAHRKRLILVIFSIAGIRIAYIISKVYDRLERRFERVGWIARLERKRKMNGR